MISRILKKTYHYTVYAVGVVVLAAATAATAVRVFLPDIGTYRSEIEAWVSNYMDQPVAIRTLNAEWYGWTPHLSLEDIDLLNAAGTSPIIHFDKARLSIDVYASLRERRILPRELVISGFSLGVIRLADGSIEVEGMKVEDYQAQAQDTLNEQLSNWLFSQKTIELQNASIQWLDQQHGQEPLLLSDVQLLLRTDGDRLQMEGSTALPPGYGSRMNFAIDARGDLSGSDWDADLYLRASDVRPENWQASYLPVNPHVGGGSATVTLWSTWQDASLIGIDGQLTYHDFSVRPVAGFELPVERLELAFAGTGGPSGNWRFDIHLDELVTGHGPWPAADYSLRVKSAAGGGPPAYALDYSYLRLDDLAVFLPLLPSLPAEARSLAADHALHGALVEGSVSIDPGAGDGSVFGFDTGFQGLRAEGLGFSPLPASLSGRIYGTPEGGRLVFDREQLEIRLPGDKDRTGELVLDGEITWLAEEGKYRLSSAGLRAANRELSATIAGSADLGGASPVLDIVACFSGTDLAAAVAYLPSTPGFRVRDWLERSLPAGEIASLDVVFRGEAAGFPFDDNSGRFLARARILDGKLNYAHGWPQISGIDADILFEGRQLQIALQRGRIYSADIAGATAFMPDLLARERFIRVQGRVEGGMLDIRRFIAQSPLARDALLAKAGSIFTGGGMGLDLELGIPILIPGQQTSMSGRLELTGADITSDLSNLELENVTGIVSFDREAVRGAGTAAFNGRDVTLELEGSRAGGEPVRISIAGTGDHEYIGSQIEQNLPGLEPVVRLLDGRLNGYAAWEASISYRPGAAGLTRLLEIKSDLVGMAVDLPPPFAKKDYERMNVLFSKEIDLAEAPRIDFQYGDVLSSVFMLEPVAGGGLKNASISLGGEAAEAPAAPGISLGGRLEQLRLDEWLAFLRPARAGIGGHRLPVRAELGLQRLLFGGQSFSDVRVRGGDEGGAWRFRLAGDAIAGEITLPAGGAGAVVEANLSRLILDKGGNGSIKNLDPAAMPSVRAHVEAFTYNGLDLGTMDLLAAATAGGLELEKLKFSKPGLSIEAGGRWKMDPYRGSTSEFSIQARAGEFAQILKTFGYNMDSIARAGTTLSIDAHWRGTPIDFSLDRLNGTINLEMGKGQLRDVEPSAGRLFGLLSLQTLPRRLVLDFSDLFGEGMAFDSISGRFSIYEGNAYTDNLAMKGPSVDISISGRAGLSKQDYDQRAVVTPQISDSLAVASGFLGPVGMGLGAVLYLAGNIFEPLQDSINQIMKFEYTITGGWDDPVIEKTEFKQGRDQ